MNCRLRVGLCLLAIAVGGRRIVAQQPAAADLRTKGATDAVAAFTRAFNAHDATALGALWADKAVHVATDSGERIEGRAALTKAYAELFAHDPKCTLGIQVSDMRLSAPTVASVDGVADVRHTTGDVTRSQFSAVLVQQNGAWLVDQVRETDVPLPSPATLHLNELAWLIGDWQGDVGKTHVTLSIHWAGNMHFLMGRLLHEEDGVATQEIVQIVGWDAEQRCLRSWQFNDGGGFSEGIWQSKGETKWVNKLVSKQPDGRRGSMTQSLIRLADNKITLQSIDREVDGEPQPNSEQATLERAAVPAAKASPPAADAKAKQPHQ